MEGKISREFLKGSHASYELSPCSSFQPGFVWWTCTVNSFHKLICIMVKASEAYWPKSRKICLSETTWKKGTGDRQLWEKHLTFYFLLNDSSWIYLKKLSCFILLHFFLCISFFFSWVLFVSSFLHSLILCLFLLVPPCLIDCQARYGKRELSLKMSKSSWEKTHICTLYTKHVQLYMDRIQDSEVQKSN